MKEQTIKLMDFNLVMVLAILLVLILNVQGFGITGTNRLTGMRAVGDTVLPLHDNVRTQPYPRAEHEIYLNPPPLIVPSSAMIKTDSIQFSLSRSLSFPSDTNTITSKFVMWAMFSPHKTLTSGTWYWKYRKKSDTGLLSDWSNVETFMVKDETPKFATPPFSRLIQGIPNAYPRLFCFLDAGLNRNRSNASKALPYEYKDMTNRTNSGLSATIASYNAITDLYTRISTISSHVTFLHTAYLVTNDSKYSAKLLDIARYMGTLSVTSSDYNEAYFVALTLPYDVCYNLMTAIERSNLEQRLLTVSESLYKNHRRYQEGHVQDNHFWQFFVHEQIRAGLLLYDKYPKAREILEYYYELYTTRAPSGGFTRDGCFYNSVGYYTVDVPEMFYTTGVLSYITGRNFLEHPWFHNAGPTFAYNLSAGSKGAGFGDVNGGSADRALVAFADYLARETNSPLTKWYVNECNRRQSNILQGDYVVRLYRFSKLDQTYPDAIFPANTPKLRWFQDSGEAMIHSDMSNMDNDLHLGFRSSPFGSGSHTLADQNAFNLLYKGEFVYHSTGAYDNFSGRHNVLWSRHTRGHNSMLIDGIGQPFTTRGYGNIPRALDGKNISYVLGDASNAYSCISEYSMWINVFKGHNITQTPSFGFGKTSLNRYRRHVLMLHPDKVVVYDDLEAGTPVRWDWLLHSPVQFQVEERNKRIVLEKNTAPLSSLESGTISGGCGTLSIDYVQSGSDNVNLDVYVNNQLVKTLTSVNEQGVVKQSGDIVVNVNGNFIIKLKQKNSGSGQVAIVGLKSTSYSVTETSSIRSVVPLLSVRVEEGTILVNTSKAGTVKVFSVVGQAIANIKVAEGQHEVLVSPGTYLVCFISNGKTESKKVIVQ